MRIIGGKFKGHRFDPPAGKWPTRPTTDFSKEALYNILENTIEFEECHFLDLFGGTGNHCYEMLSRGAEHATYVDKFIPCIKFVERMKEKLELENQLKIVKADVFKFIASKPGQFDYIFAGPPYSLKNIQHIPDLIFKYQLLKDDGLFVLEHNQHFQFRHHPYFEDVRNYGQTHFSFFKW